MNKLFKNYNITGFALPAVFFWGAAFITFIRIIVGALPHKTYFLGVSAGPTFMSIVSLLALAGVGVFTFLKFKFGMAVSAATLALMEFINYCVATVFVFRYMGSFNFGSSLRLGTYYWFKLIAFLAITAVIVLPCFTEKTRNIVNKLFFIPAAVFGVPTLLGATVIHSPAAVIILLENLTICAALLMLGLWVKKEIVIADDSNSSRKRTANNSHSYNYSGNYSTNGYSYNYSGGGSSNNNSSNYTGGFSSNNYAGNTSNTASGATNNDYVQADASVIIQCPNCGQKLKLPMGKELSVTCPKCKNNFITRT